MDIGNTLMNQIRSQNSPQAQLIQQTNQMADNFQNMPQQNPMGNAMMKFGLGVLSAPPEMQSSQAMGLAGQEAMKAYDEVNQRNMQNQMQSVALRQVAANTIDAVNKFKMESEYKNRALGIQERQTDEASRHNRMQEQLKLLELGQQNQSNMNDMNKPYFSKIGEDYHLLKKSIEEKKRVLQQLGNNISVKHINPSVSKENQAVNTWFNKNSQNDMTQRLANDIINATSKEVALTLQPFVSRIPNGQLIANSASEQSLPVIEEVLKSGVDPTFLSEKIKSIYSKAAQTNKLEEAPALLREYFLGGKKHE